MESNISNNHNEATYSDEPPTYESIVSPSGSSTQFETRQLSVEPTQIRIKPLYGPNSMNVQCPKCKSWISTKTKTEMGALALIAVGVCCILCWPCAWLPCVLDDLKDVVHSCPKCKIEIGRHTKL